MTRFERSANIAAVLLPFVALIAAVTVFWDHGVGLADLAVMLAMYLLTGLGITIGYHRLFTHNAFSAKRSVRYTLAVLGSMAVEGPLSDWVADHRKHHAHTDEEGDPHSPHVGAGSGVAGLWHAHIGWLYRTQGQAATRRYAPDIVEDPGLRLISRRFGELVLLSLLIPFAAGFAIHGTLGGALLTLLWAGLVRIFLLHHVTWSINSVCHFFGRRRFEVEDRSTNVFWLAIPSLGESWHHNHHAFPRSASHGLRAWELDPSAGVIWVLEKLGLVSDVVRIGPERQRRREAAPAPGRGVGERA
ncbi:MAG TPA: acyl-CoA desaturase [Solirubrobacteraceae bacterium]|jgi:stearoyl-CoA desaturase (delta-9 desaturase)|nr:acyl-CoA desaturase [Solirubrobacteraceae bacterium]